MKKNISKTEILTDKKVINGLLIVTDIKKIEANCKKFNIQLPKTEPNIRISKRGEISIITILFETKKHTQFLVNNELKTNELRDINHINITNEIKEYIVTAHRLTSSFTLRELLS